MIKKLRFAILGVVFIINNAVAEMIWQPVNSPSGGLVYPLHIDSNSHLYAVLNGSLAKSTDQGVTWTTILTDAAFFKLGLNSSLYAETSAGLISYSTDGGGIWTALPATLNNLHVDRMAIAANGTLYFAGGDYLYTSPDNGVTWTSSTFKFNGNALRVIVDKSNRLYVYGNNRLYFSATTINAMQVVLDATGPIRAVLPTSVNHLFVSMDNNGSGLVRKSTDLGQTWQSTDLPYARALYESPQGYILGAGASPDYLNANNSFISQNNGATWTALSLGAPIFAFAMANDGKLFAASDGLFISTNNGATFTSGSPNHATVRAIVKDAQNRMFSVTGLDKKYTRYWHSANNGSSWSEISRKSFNQPLAFFDAKNVDNNRLWMLVGTGAAGDTVVNKCLLYESTDGGRTWGVTPKRELNGAGGGFVVDYSLSLVYQWLAGEKYFYRTGDFGASWIPITLPFEAGELFAASDGLVYGFSKSDVQKIRRLYYSTDRGEKWNYVNVPYDDAGIAKMAIDRFGHIYKLTAKKNGATYTLSNLVHSGDFGRTFADVTPSLPAELAASASMFTFSLDAYGGLFLIGSSGVALSRDNANAWETIYSQEAGEPVYRCLFAGSGVDIYAGSTANGIYKTEKTPLTFVPKALDGLTLPIAATYGVSWVDFNADGHEDIFLVNDGPNSLYQNNGDGTFKQITTGNIVTDNESSRSASWADYDNDGYPDCFVANGGGATNSLYRNLRDGTFYKITSGNIVEDAGNFRSCAWADMENDGDLDLYVTNLDEIGTNILYVNDGSNHWSKSKDIVVGAPGDKTYGCAWGDFNNDGLLDIYLANYGADRLFQQAAKGVFTQVGPSRIEPNTGVAVSCSWADYNNDGFLDIFVTNTDRANCLYRNNGDGSFTKITAAGIGTDNKISKGSGWADYDNDGNIDLFVSNRNSCLFYRNDGAGNFASTPGKEFYFFGGNSLALAWGDKDNDGDLDLVIGSYDQQTLLYENLSTPGKWLKIRCVGDVNDLGNGKSNHSAIGAKVRVKTTVNGQSRWQVREVTAQTGHAAQSSIIQHFGLGGATKADSVVIDWPSRIRQVLENRSANQKITVVEAGKPPNDVVAVKDEMPRAYSLSPNYPNPFNPSTTIEFGLPRHTLVLLTVYDATGHFVKTLVNESKPAGVYAVEWDGRDETGIPAASGLYFYHLKTDEFEDIGKMTLLK